jgi:hypothetical protein
LLDNSNVCDFLILKKDFVSQSTFFIFWIDQDETTISSRSSDEVITEYFEIGNTYTIDHDDRYTNEILHDALQLIDSDGKKPSLASVEEITGHMATGSLYHIKCSLTFNGKTVKCLLKVWSRVWLEDPKEKLKVNADCEGVTINGNADDIPSE